MEQPKVGTKYRSKNAFSFEHSGLRLEEGSIFEVLPWIEDHVKLSHFASGTSICIDTLEGFAERFEPVVEKEQ